MQAFFMDGRVLYSLHQKNLHPYCRTTVQLQLSAPLPIPLHSMTDAPAAGSTTGRWTTAILISMGDLCWPMMIPWNIAETTSAPKWMTQAYY